MGADAPGSAALLAEIEQLKARHLELKDWLDEHPLVPDWNRRDAMIDATTNKLAALNARQAGWEMCLGCFGKTLPGKAAANWRADGGFWRCPECEEMLGRVAR